MDQMAHDAAGVPGERLERGRRKSLFIATPIARHPVHQYTVALNRTVVLLAQLGIPAYVQAVRGNSNLPRARNELVAAFLASPYSDMLMVDDDMGWEPNDVLRLLASDQPVIAGVGAKKSLRPDTDPTKWCCRVWKDRPIEQDDMGAISVAAVGTGFIKVHRSVFESLAAAHPEWKGNGWDNMPAAARQHYYRFFRFPDGPEEWGEDFHFCQTWLDHGGAIWIDPTIKLVHVGEFEFTGDFTALLQPAETVTA